MVKTFMVLRVRACYNVSMPLSPKSLRNGALTKTGRKRVAATCHPNRKHYGKGLCKSCYRKQNKPPVTEKTRSYFAERARIQRKKAIETGVPLCKHKDRPHWKAGVCKECYKERQDEKRRIYKCNGGEGDSNGFRHYLKKSYGITLEQYDNMLYEQGGACAICGREDAGNIAGKRMHVDHDHSTNEIRGLLCGHCNRGIGCFFDNPELLMAAVRYIQSYRKEAGDER